MTRKKSTSSKKEEFVVDGKDVVDKVRQIIKEGNARRIIIKDKKDETFMEIPLTVAAVGAVLVPIFAALGALAALVSECKIVVEKKD